MLIQVDVFPIRTSARTDVDGLARREVGKDSRDWGERLKDFTSAARFVLVTH